MTFAIFGSSNPQPVAYTGEHLAKLDAFYKGDRAVLTTFILARIMAVGAAVRMFVDAGRYTSHALHDCWENKTITSLAGDSLFQTGKHLLLAIFTVAIGIIAPSMLLKVAERANMMPVHSFADTVATAAKVVTCGALLFGVCVGVGRAIVMTEVEQQAIKAFATQKVDKLKILAQPVVDKLGQQNVESLGIGALLTTIVSAVVLGVRAVIREDNDFSV
jgi:hypothetical protein